MTAIRKRSQSPAPRNALKRSFRGVALETRQQLRREQLLLAGIEAFGSRGYHAVTVREICVGAHLTERYFYESFRSLEELFAAVYTQLARELKEVTLKALGDAPKQPLALAEAGLRVFFEYVRHDPRRARIMLIDAIGVGHDISRIAEATTRDYMQLLRELIDTLYPQAKAAGLDADLIAAGLIGANVHIATRWVREGFCMSIEKVMFNTLALYRPLVAQMGHDRTARKAAKRSPIRTTKSAVAGTAPRRIRSKV